MNFIDGLNFYFTKIFGLEVIFVTLLFSFGLAISCWPKNNVFNKQVIIKLSLIFLGGYATSILLSSLVFGLVYAIPDVNIQTFIYSMVSPLIVLCFVILFIKGKPLHKFIKAIILLAIIIICDVLSKNLGFAIGLLTSIKLFVALSRAIPFSIFVLFCFLLNKVDINRYGNLSKEMVIIINIVSIIIIGVGVYEHIDSTMELSVNILFSILDCLLIALLGFTYYTTYKNVENRHKITTLEVQKTLQEAEEMSVIVNQTNLEELQKLRHDIKNQFSYLEILLKQDKNQEALEYVNKYLGSYDPILNSFSCSNSVINSIINLEITKAKIKNIKLDVKAVVPPALPFKDVDLVSLLTNIIDNAIENYYSTKNEKIIIRIMKQNDFIRFIVSNPIDVNKVSLNNLTKTKKIGRGHGYGTKIIKNIAEQYDGFADFGVEDNLFVSDVVLNLNIKE